MQCCPSHHRPNRRRGHWGKWHLVYYHLLARIRGELRVRYFILSSNIHTRIHRFNVQCFHFLSTVKETIIDDGVNGIWTFDQLQGVVNVNVPVRMTVVKVIVGVRVFVVESFDLHTELQEYVTL